MISLNVSVFICLQVVVIFVAMTLISVGAYEIKRDIRQRNFFLDQPFIDKTFGLQTSAVVPVRDRTVGLRALRDISLKDRAVYPSGFPIFRHQPIKQNSFTITSFRDKPLFKDAVLKNRQLRGERAILRDNPFGGQLLTPEEIFEGQASTYRNQAPFKEQLFATETPFKNLFRGQSSSAEQAMFQKQATFVDSSPFASNSIKFYRDDYIKPMDSYERYKDMLTSFNGKSSIHTKYNNNGPRVSSMPMIPSSDYLLPLNAELPSWPIVSSACLGMGEAHSSEDSKMKLGSMLTSASNCNAPVDISPTTIPSISVSTNQSSIVGHILTSLTTKPSSPVTGTSIASSAGNFYEPIYFHATKHGAVASSLPTLNELNSDIRTLSRTPKSNFEINEHDFKFLPLEVPKNIETQSIANYILPEEQNSGLKGIQNSLTDYALPVKLKHDWPLQQFAQLGTSSDYALLSLNGKTKLVPPSIPVAPISWPIEIKSDIPTMLPSKSIMTSDSTTKNKLLLDVDLPTDFTANIPNSLPSSAANGISGSITGGISTGIPGSMTTDIPASIPTLNLGQSLHHVEQLRPTTQEARNPWYPTGLQLQLGGFGGINYTLNTGNSATRSVELGIAKAGLTSPKLPQPHAPAFAKIGVGFHL